MKDNKSNIDPKDLMAVERSTTGLYGVAISLIVLGFIVEKFELFLNVIGIELQDKTRVNLPQLEHIEFYKYLGISIVIVGVLLAIYTYRYYLNWIKHLENKEIDTDKNIYLVISIFIGLIGIILIASMMFI